MTIRMQGTYVVIRKIGSAIDGSVHKTLTLADAEEAANEDWLRCCDDQLLCYNVLNFTNTGNYHIADAGDGYTYTIVHIPANPGEE